MQRTMLKGAMVGSVFTLVVSASAVALAGTGVGAPFNLGKTNTVNATSTLSGKTAGAMLRVDNTGTGPAAVLNGAVGPVAKFNAAGGAPPFAVNNNTKVANLNADLLDGNDASAFLGANDTAVNSNQLGGLGASSYQKHAAIHLVQGSPISVPAGGTGTALASCTDSELAISGGVRWNPTTGMNLLTIAMAGPSARVDGSFGAWRVDGHNGTASQVSLIPYVLCIDK